TKILPQIEWSLPLHFASREGLRHLTSERLSIRRSVVYLLVAPELHAALQRAQLRPGGIDVGKLLDESLHQGFSRSVGFGPQPFFDERPTVSEGIDPRPPPVFGGGLSPPSGRAVNLLPRRREPVEKRRQVFACARRRSRVAVRGHRQLL